MPPSQGALGRGGHAQQETVGPGKVEKTSDDGSIAIFVETVCQKLQCGVAEGYYGGSTDNAPKVELQVCWIVVDTPASSGVGGVVTGNEISGVKARGKRVGDSRRRRV